MAISNSATWSWEKTDTTRSGGAGDLAKLFKNEKVASPGVLAVDAPPAAATLLAREVLQNSWDAAHELQVSRRQSGAEAPPFSIDFAFRKVPAHDDALSALDLAGLATHYNLVDPDDRRSLGLARASALSGTEPVSRPHDVLVIKESGTTGMYGAFESPQSKMFLALVSLGYTVKAPGSGGSYGFGKAGLIAGSATRTVIAYSCFEAREDDITDDGPVTRRLLGMTYWGQHTIDGVSNTGFARLGRDEGDSVKPFVNSHADSMARRLGLDLRDSGNPADLGTTFVLLDPVVEPADLKNAVERNWWAAIEERRFTVTISSTNDDGETLYTPRPKTNPALKSFIRAYEIATVPQDNSVDHEHFANLGNLQPKLGERASGNLGLVADLAGWSYAIGDESDDESVSHRSMIALLRGPLMTVEYFSPRRTGNPPYVRGAFVADPEVDDLLRQTEPKAHDAWVTDIENLGDEVDQTAPMVAKEIIARISSQTREFQTRLRPPPPDTSHVRLNVLADLFKNLIRGEAKVPPPPPPAGQREFSIRIDDKLQADEANQRLIAKGVVRVTLADSYTDGDKVNAKIRVSYRFVEDDSAGEECPLTISVDGATVDPDGWLRIEITRTETEIRFVSVPYAPDWSGRLAVAALVDPQGK